MCVIYLLSIGNVAETFTQLLKTSVDHFLILVLVIADDDLYDTVDGALKLLKNEHIIVFPFRKMQAQQLIEAVPKWTSDKAVDDRIAMLLNSDEQFIYFRGGPAFGAYTPNNFEAFIKALRAYIDNYLKPAI